MGEDGEGGVEGRRQRDDGGIGDRQTALQGVAVVDSSSMTATGGRESAKNKAL